MHAPRLWHRLKDMVLSTQPQRRSMMALAVLALVLMIGSSGVMLLLAYFSPGVNGRLVAVWAALSVGGLAVMTALIRSGATRRLSDPSLTVPQMVWTITSGAVAYVLAGEARGLVPSVLAMILFFGTFGLGTRQVIGVGVYALLSFGVATAVAAHLNPLGLGVIEIAYGLMVFIVLSGCIALNLRIQAIRERLRSQRTALEQALAENRELATRDTLTALLNRRAMMDLMLLEQRRTLRTNRPLLLAQLDIDHFKRINDTLGHAAGDRALQQFAVTVKACVRDTDVLSRWGGEEFVLMLSETTREQGEALLERVRQSVAAMAVPDTDPPAHFTASIGLAEFLPGETIDQTLARADEALYRAKSGGRNRVEVAPERRGISLVQAINARA